MIEAKVQECLGQIYLENNDFVDAEKWYRKALQCVMDICGIEELTDVSTELQILKCKFS